MYHDAAVRFAQGGSLAEGPFYHAPGYAVFLGTLYKGFGASPWTGLVANFVLGTLATLLIYLIGARWFSRPTGVLAALLFTGYGPELFFETKLLIAPLALMLSLALAWGVSQAERGLAKHPTVWATAAGLIAGALSVVRPNVAMIHPRLDM